MTRPSWNSYFLSLARVVATRGTCPRKQVGAVIVRDRQVLATGYNGSIPDDPHCIDVGCQMESGHCIRTVHAEVNAIAQAARHGVSIAGGTLYTTLSPCLNCWKTIRSAGIGKVIYGESYENDHCVSFGTFIDWEEDPRITEQT